MTKAIKVWACVLLGICIPLISFLLAHAGGDMLHKLEDVTVWRESWVGFACLFLCASILSVSLSHVAESIVILSNSKGWQAWALAIALDCSLITMELARILNNYDNWLSRTLMGTVVVWSAALNVIAFLGAMEGHGIRISLNGSHPRNASGARPVLDLGVRAR